MTPSGPEKLEDLLAAHLEGRSPVVPESLREEFEQALAGHAALQEMFDDTVGCVSDFSGERPPPDLPDEYQIEREIGRGGMGIVYLAHQRSLNRDVALKVLRPGEQTFGPLIKRFLGEARHLARLRHPNIVAIHEVGDAHGEPYFTMDFIDGEPLSAEIRRGPMSPAQALSILKQVAAGVQHAHRQGIIHRDLKPANVLVDRDGRAFVTDFGLARDVSRDSSLTQTGELLGTPQYMAPEQARGQVSLIGEATDIHALGLLLFEMLTGRPAFESSSPAEVLVRLIHEDPPPLRSLDPRIPRDLETICQKMLQKAPAARYAGIGALLEDIRRLESGESLLARRAGVPTRVIRWGRRHWKLVAAVIGTAAFMLLALLAAGPLLFDKTREELIAWAEELDSRGGHEEAVRVYRRALENTEGPQRGEILERMIRCCGKIDDAGKLVAAALPILKETPQASFGRHDYLVAQAVYAAMLASHPNLTAAVANRSAEDYAQLEFAATRYQVFLDGPYGSAPERKLAAETLSGLRRFLEVRATPGNLAGLPSAGNQPPESPADDLSESAGDAAASRWQRGKAAYARGKLLEQSGKREDARQAFAEAFEQMRAVFPTYEGVSTTMFRSLATGVKHVESPECALLREVFAAVQRLDPAVPNALQGGLRFRVAGVALPEDFILRLHVELHDLSATKAETGDAWLPRMVPITRQTGRVGVADGRYQASIRLGGTSSLESGSRLNSLLEFDFSALPTEVEIQGNTLELVIPARMVSEMSLIAPAMNATVDLRTELFQWSRIEGAAYYNLTFARKESKVGEGSSYTSGASIRVASNSVCLGTLPEVEQAKTSQLVAGTTVVWSINAHDQQGRRIGSSVQTDRSFLVGHGLGTGGTNE